jgi:deoxyribodipyrimidine photo-lyase
MTTGIIWFTTDLRLHDNEALTIALKNNEQIVPVYCLDQEQFRQEQFGFRRMGARRLQFLQETLLDLDAQLRALGSGLMILYGKADEVLPAFVSSYQARTVYAKKEIVPEEKAVQARVEKALWKVNAVLEVFSTSTMYHPQDLPFGVSHIPDLFTSFRKKVEKETVVRPVFDVPGSISSPVIPVLKLPSLSELGFELQTTDDRTVFPFKGGETQALQRLQDYLYTTRSILTYKETRNGLVGVDYSSKFSPWLALGSLSPKWIYHAIREFEKKNGANDSTYWLIFELLWRDFFRFMIKKHGEKYFRYNGISGKHEPAPEGNDKALLSWIEGHTGDDFVDANMKELAATGFMSNRGRQNVASYFINDLKQDWRVGAAYFEQELIDYDPCSNYCNWAYLAGVGNDNRSDRYFDTRKQAETYDKDRSYREKWK